MTRRLNRQPIRALLLVALTALISCGSPTKRGEMSIEVRLEVAKTDLLFQENPPVRLIVTNRGRSAVSVQSIHHPAVPTFRVVEVQTGAESLHKGDPGVTGISRASLEAGSSFEKTFPLLQSIRVPRPGEYELTALVEYGEGTRSAESAPLRLSFRPAAPTGISLVSVSGGASGLLYGATVNARSDPPEIVRYALSKSAQDGVVDARSVAPALLGSRLVLSSPRNQIVEHSHFIAWITGNSFSHTHVDADGTSQPTGSRQLDGVDPRIIAISLAPFDPTNPKATGEALLLHNSPTAGPYFSVLHLTKLEARAGSSVAAAGGNVLWAAGLEKSKGKRVVLSIHEEPDGLALRDQAWPGHEAEAGQLGQVLAAWEDVTFVGGAVTLSAEDATYGASLVRSTNLDEPKLEMRTWTLSENGAFSELGRGLIDWGESTAIDAVRVAVGPTGSAAALIRDGDGQWFVFDVVGGIRPVTGRLEKTDLTFNIAFFASGPPVLIAASIEGGLQLLELTGAPLVPPAG